MINTNDHLIDMTTGGPDPNVVVDKARDAYRLPTSGESTVSFYNESKHW